MFVGYVILSEVNIALGTVHCKNADISKCGLNVSDKGHAEGGRKRKQGEVYEAHDRGL